MLPLRVLCGPTASGKSAVALDLARREHAELLSIDSMKIYRRLDIGTAKPDPATRKRVVHHLIDIVEPHDHFSVADVLRQDEADPVDCHHRGVARIAEGGTRVYLDSLSEDIV